MWLLRLVHSGSMYNKLQAKNLKDLKKLKIKKVGLVLK